MMAKQFHFDDEDDIQEDYQSSYLDELENKKENAPYISIDEEDDNEGRGTNEEKEKRFCNEMVALCIDIIWCAGDCFYCLYCGFIIA